MIWLWLTLAFVAGAACYHFVGPKMLRKAFGSSTWTNDILEGLSVESLLKLEQKARREIDRRQALLREKRP